MLASRHSNHDAGSSYCDNQVSWRSNENFLIIRFHVNENSKSIYSYDNGNTILVDYVAIHVISRIKKPYFL